MKKRTLRPKKECSCCDRPKTRDYITFYGKNDKKIHVCKDCYINGSPRNSHGM
jgi:hypothetical protein